MWTKSNKISVCIDIQLSPRSYWPTKCSLISVAKILPIQTLLSLLYSSRSPQISASYWFISKCILLASTIKMLIFNPNLGDQEREKRGKWESKAYPDFYFIFKSKQKFSKKSLTITEIKLLLHFTLRWCIPIPHISISQFQNTEYKQKAVNHDSAPDYQKRKRVRKGRTSKHLHDMR